jgi:hypothetical protein
MIRAAAITASVPARNPVADPSSIAIAAPKAR